MQFSLLVILGLFFSACAGTSSSLANPAFVEVPLTAKAKWNEPVPSNKEVPTVREVYNHRAPGEDGIVYENGKKASKMASPAGTIAHELVHGINSHWRNLRSGHAAFYVPFVGVAYLKNPMAKRIQMATLIAPELRGIDGTGGRFHEYIQTKAGGEPDAGTYFDPSNGKKLWGETDVFYIWDEWNAYIVGGRAYLEAEQTFGPERWDGLTGPVEFMIYAAAGLQAIQKHDLSYYQSAHYKEAKDLFAFFAEETVKLLSDGKGSTLKGEKAEAYLERLRGSQSPQAVQLREFLRAEFGADWTSHTLGL
ncbi:hypothetical protein EBR78_03970 [bacterium]|nr:hypothetical protein [bacterium]